MCTEYGDIRDTQYGYAMDDFDGTTGFDLYYRLCDEDREYLENMVRHYIRYSSKEGGDGRVGNKRGRKK